MRSSGCSCSKTASLRYTCSWPSSMARLQRRLWILLPESHWEIWRLLRRPTTLAPHLCSRWTKTIFRYFSAYISDILCGVSRYYPAKWRKSTRGSNWDSIHWPFTSVDGASIHIPVIVKNSSRKNLLASCRPTAGRLSANCWPTVGRQV